MASDAPVADAPATPVKTEKPWTIGRRLRTSLYSLIAAAGLLGLTVLGLALAWHLLQEPHTFAFGSLIGILVLRWVGLYGLGVLLIAIIAPFTAASPYASEEATGYAHGRSAQAGNVNAGFAAFDDCADDID